MAIRFLSGQTIDGTLQVTGNVQAATFNTLPIETARNNNANRIVRTNVHGYVDFGWINTTSGNHTGSITRITASNDAYLRYVTPAQFRTGVTDGYYAPASTVSGVTSVATGNGLIGGTITSTGTLTMSGDYTGIFTVHEGQVWDPTTQGTAKGSIHIDPDEGTDHAGGALTFGASDASSGSNSQAGIYIRSDGSYGTKMYLATTDSYATGSKTALNIDHSGNVNITRGFLQVSNGNISLSGTGRIQGVDTVSASTDAANKAYVDAHPGSGGTVTSVATGNGLTGGTITTTGTLSMSGSYTGNYVITGGLSVQGNNIFGMGISTGSWYGDLGSHGYTRETGLAMTGGSEFVVLSKSGQGSVLVDGAYLAYESANGFFGSYNSSYGNLTGIQATGANTITVKQLDGGTANLTITDTLNSNSYANQSGGLLFSAGQTTGTPRSLNLRTSSPTGDPSSSDQGASTGITWGQRTDSNPYYIIYPKLENWNSSGNYSKLTLAWHTGIKIGADKAYGGTRFYNQSPDIAGASIIMNVGVGSDEINIVKNLQVTGSMYQDVSSIGGYIVKPKGADFFTAASQQTGAIEIRFPTGGATRNDMVFFTVDVYQYTTNRSFSIKAGGYIYQGIGSNTWVNVFAQVYAKNSNQNYTIRFGDNGSTHCMWIGESTDSWSYSQIVVRDFFGGYATDINQYKEGWDITFDSLSGKTINNTLTNNFPLAQDIISGAYLPLSGGTMSGNIQMLSNSLQFDQTGTRSWNISPGSGNLNITSGDSVGSVSLNCGLIVADTLTASSRIIIQSRNDNTNVGTINSTNNQSDWQNLVASSGQFTVTQYNNISNYTNAPSGVYTYGSVLSTRTANHSFQLYSAHTGDLCYKTQWNNDNYSGWRGIPVYGANSGSPSVKDLYSTRVYDSDNTAYFMDPHSTSQVNTIEWVNSTNNGRFFANDWGLKLQTDAGYIHFGPANTSHAHIYTDRSNFYFNKQIQLLGGSLINQNDIRAGIFYDVNNTSYYVQPRSTSNLVGLTVANTITGTISQSNKVAITGYQTNGFSFYQTSGSFAGNSGWANYYIGNHGDGSNYYNTTIIFPFWGPPKYTRLENNTLRGPYNFLNNEVDQTIGVYLQSTTSLRAPIFYDYNNTAFYIDPSTTGTSVNVAGDVVAYASSDIRFKNNVTPITNALDKLSKIGGYTFEWNEISHKETGKKDIGVVAQEVEEILPEIVQTRSNGYKAVDYQKLTALLIESVKEQQFIIDDLKSRIERLEKI